MDEQTKKPVSEADIYSDIEKFKALGSDIEKFIWQKKNETEALKKLLKSLEQDKSSTHNELKNSNGKG